MKKMILGLGALAMMVMIMTSCSQEPTAEVETANAAIEAAKTIEADRYCASEFTALNDSLNVVLTAIEAEKEKSASTRNFTPLAEKLATITATAQELATKAETVKAETRDQVQNEVVSITEMANAAKESLAKIVKNRQNAEQLDAIANQIAVVESALIEVNTLVTNGDYLTAKEKANSAKEVITIISTQL
jgi:hypothetical protein